MTRRRWTVAVLLLAVPALARAQHAGDMLIASTAADGGTLALDYDFSSPVAVFESASGGGNTLFVSTDPGWDLVVDPGDGFFPLAGGTSVAVQITAIDPGVSLKIGTTTLGAAGQSRTLGAAPAIHVHPTWQLVLPAGMRAERAVSFRLTTPSAVYGDSIEYTAFVSNTTTTSSTTTTAAPGESTTTSTLPDPPTTTTVRVTSTTSPPPTTTTTSSTAPPGSTTSSTLAPRGDLLRGTSLALRARRDRLVLALRSRDPAVVLGDTRGGAGDPTLHGGSLTLAGADAGPGGIYDLPARNWRALTRRHTLVGWRYADPNGLAGPVRSALVRAGKTVRIVARGADLGIELATNPDPIRVTLAAGSQRWCLRFGGTARWQPGASFVARAAAPPEACAR